MRAGGTIHEYGNRLAEKHLMFQTLITIVGIGIVVGITLIFWAEIQNWMAGVIERAQSFLGPATHTVQSALVILDRVVVNGQRMIAIAGRTILLNREERTEVTTEEVRYVDPNTLPPELRSKLDAGNPLTYEVSTGNDE